MKKTLFTVAMLSVLSSTAVYAYSNSPMDMKGEIQPMAMPVVTIPLYQGHFTFAAEGDYDLLTNPAVTNSTHLITDSNGTNFRYLQFVIPHSHWAYKLYAGYTFPNSGNDIEAIWQSYNASFSNTMTSPFSAGNNTLNSVQIGAANYINANEAIHYEYLDLVVGQHYNFGCRVHGRAFVGLRYVHLNDDLRQHAVNNFFRGVGVEVNVASLLPTETFRGLGLRFGLDNNVDIAYGLSLTSTVGGSLLGVSDTTAQMSTISVFSATTGLYDAARSQTAMVASSSVLTLAPELDGRVGLKYAYAYGNSDENSIAVEGGYQMETYFESLNIFTMRGPYVKAEVNF